MTVEERIVEAAKKRAEGLTLEAACIGVGYTGVKLSDGHGGASYTFRDQLGRACGVIKTPGKLKGTPAEKLVDWMLSDNLAEASIGTAAVNALLNRDFKRGANIAKEVECGEDDVVGMVGFFCPLVWKYQKAKELYIFDQHENITEPAGIAKLEDAKKAYEILPKCNKVVLTGTSFINGTADGLLAACKNAKEIIIVGASTPMCPEVLKDYGVTVLAGANITDADQMLRVVAEGGGGMDLSPVSDKLLERI